MLNKLPKHRPLKTAKERAFLQELFVAADWGERFAELIDKHVKLPKTGNALYVASGTGSHAVALQERAGEKLTFIAVDESDENLELSRAKAQATAQHDIEFRKDKLGSLALGENQFKLVIGDGSLVHSERIPEMFEEMVRVAAPGATVALALPTFSSFGEFFSIYWEALHNLRFIDHEGDVETLISVLPAVSRMEEMAEEAGLENVSSATSIEEFDFESAEKFLSDPLVADFLMPIWLESLPLNSHQQVLNEIARLVNEESHEVGFALTMKATLVMGEKAVGH